MHTDTKQSDQILAHLQAGYAITPLEALEFFHCLRLGARVWELKKVGHPICKKMVDVGYGKKVAEYRLETA